jgi:hypothetical protein
MKRIILFLTTILLVLGNLAYGGGMPFTGSVDWTDVEGKNASGLPFDNTTAGLAGDPDDVQAAIEALDAAIAGVESAGVTDFDLFPNDTDDDDLMEADNIEIATSSGLGVSMFSNSHFVVTAGGSVSVKANTFQPYDADLTSWGAISPTAPVFTGASITSGIAGSQQGALVLNSNTHAVYNFTLLPGTMTAGVSWRLPGAMPAGDNYLVNIDQTTGQMDYTDPATFATSGHTHDYSGTYQGLDADLSTWAGLTPSSDFQSLVPLSLAQIASSLGVEAGTHDAVTIASGIGALTLNGQELSASAKIEAIHDLANAAGYLKNDGSGNFSYDNPAGTGDMNDLIDDLTPQLGGPLDVNSQEIQSTGNIVLQLGDAAGTNKLSIQDSDGNEVYSINSDGTAAGAASATPQLILTDTSAATAEATIAVNSSGAYDAIMHLGVEDSTGESTPYIDLDGVDERIELLKYVLFSSSMGITSSTQIAGRDMGSNNGELSFKVLVDNTMTGFFRLCGDCGVIHMDKPVDLLDIDTAGVGLTASNGVMTITGKGDGQDESLTIDLNSTANTAKIGTGTGVTSIDIGDINLLAGNINGLTRAVVLTHASGAHDGTDNASTLADSGESFTANSMVGMTLYNITDGSSGLVTANDGTTITATLAGGTDNDWDASDVWQVGPGPDQSGSVFYVGAASTIRHPSTAGYAAQYYATAAAAIIVDVASSSMVITNATAAAIDAGDSIDSPATAGSFICLHNASTTIAYSHGKNGTWTDGGAD